MDRGPWEICRTMATALIPFLHYNSQPYACITQHLRRRYIAQHNDNGAKSTYHLFRRHIKCPNTTSNKYFIIYSTAGSNMKLDWNAQVAHASSMHSPVIRFWKRRLINHAHLHTLTARSLPDRSVATDADNIVFLRPNLLSLSAHSG